MNVRILLGRPQIREGKEAGLHRFVERFASALVDGGMSRMPARIFTALLASETGSYTATELAERLRASPAAISGGVRYLLSIGMINREGEPGSRRHHYRVPDDVWEQMIVLEQRQLARYAQMLREGAGLAGPDSRTGRRIAESADYMEFLSDDMRAMTKRWHEYLGAKAAGTNG